jgi:hypothetical protein
MGRRKTKASTVFDRSLEGARRVIRKSVVKRAMCKCPCGRTRAILLAKIEDNKWQKCPFCRRTTWHSRV